MRYLFRMVPHSHSREAFLLSVRALARSVGAEARNPKWTSYGALELDVFAPSAPDFQLFLAAAGPLGRLEFFRDLNVAPQAKPEEQLYAEARQYFNSERYWECHEVLETVWRSKTGDEKLFLQGVILVCAAFVHHQKGEDSVALDMMKRARSQLDLGSGRPGIDASSLRDGADRVLRSGSFENFAL